MNDRQQEGAKALLGLIDGLSQDQTALERRCKMMNGEINRLNEENRGLRQEVEITRQLNEALRQREADSSAQRMAEQERDVKAGTWPA